MRGLEWAGGLFEGEGSICVRMRRHGRQEVQVSLTSTDEDTVRAFFRCIRLGGIHGPYQYKSNKKPYWMWSCHMWAEALLCFKLLWPYLGHRRREQIKTARAAWKVRTQDEHWLRS